MKAIGKGSYGVVVSAADSRLPHRVAIKKISPISAHAQDAKHVLREMRLMKVLGRHDNVVSLKNLFVREQDDELYIVMELLDSDLHRIIQSSQPLTDAHNKYFMVQLLRGVKFIHSLGVIHRDLKPGNLLVSKNCELRITDFGLARLKAVRYDNSGAEVEEAMTEHVVTRWYRPPELMLCPDGLYSAAIDVWSIGCIFAELLARKPLFPGKNFVHQLTLIFDVIGSPRPDQVSHIRSKQARKFLDSVAGKASVPLSTLYPQCSPQAVDLLTKMLVFEPGNRWDCDRCLAHPYFDGVRTVEDSRPPAPLASDVADLDFEFENLNLQRGRLKALILEEVKTVQRAAAKTEAANAATRSMVGGEGGGMPVAPPAAPPPPAAAAHRAPETNNGYSNGNSNSNNTNAKQATLAGSSAAAAVAAAAKAANEAAEKRNAALAARMREREEEEERERKEAAERREKERLRIANDLRRREEERAKLANFMNNNKKGAAIDSYSDDEDDDAAEAPTPKVRHHREEEEKRPTYTSKVTASSSSSSSSSSPDENTPPPPRNAVVASARPAAKPAFAAASVKVDDPPPLPTRRPTSTSQRDEKEEEDDDEEDDDDDNDDYDNDDEDEDEEPAKLKHSPKMSHAAHRYSEAAIGMASNNNATAKPALRSQSAGGSTEHAPPPRNSNNNNVLQQRGAEMSAVDRAKRLEQAAEALSRAINGGKSEKPQHEKQQHNVVNRVKFVPEESKQSAAAPGKEKPKRQCTVPKSPKFSVMSWQKKEGPAVGGGAGAAQRRGVKGGWE